MRPILFRIPGLNLPIYSYGVMLGLSLILGWYLVLGLAERDGLNREKMGNLYVWTAVWSVIGSRILFVLTNLDRFDNPIDIIRVDSGGLVAYGGFLGGFFSSLIYCRMKKISVLMWADCGTVALGSGLGLTRIGCFLYGCDYGMRTTSGLGISFPKGSPAWQDQGPGVPGWTELASAPVHPTQLYESFFGFLLLGIMLLTRTKALRRFSGQTFFTFVIVYGIGRSLLEVVRDDPQRGGFAGLSTSQLIGISTAVIGLAAYLYFWQKSRKDPEGAQLWKRELAKVQAASGARSGGGGGSDGDGDGAESGRPRHKRARKAGSR